MPHIEESRHRGRSRSAPASFCTWKGVHPNVLGSLVVRLSELGYGILYGTTSDGGRLTLSVYMGERRRTAYFKGDVTPAEIFDKVAEILDLPSRPTPTTRKVDKQLVKSRKPPAAIRTETAPEKADRLREARQYQMQIEGIRQLTGRTPEGFDIILNPNTII
jgi:hypothetical protein